jgi:hypothetical protein
MHTCLGHMIYESGWFIDDVIDVMISDRGISDSDYRDRLISDKLIISDRLIIIGGCSLLPVGAGEYIGSWSFLQVGACKSGGWSLLPVGAGEFREL